MALRARGAVSLLVDGQVLRLVWSAGTARTGRGSELEIALALGAGVC